MNGEGEKEKVITKQHPSAFTGTDLQRVLEGCGKKKIVLAGEFAFEGPFFVCLFV